METRIGIELDEKTFYAFRKDAFETFGMQKGSIKKAVVEAIHMWLEAKTVPVQRVKPKNGHF